LFPRVNRHTCTWSIRGGEAPLNGKRQDNGKVRRGAWLLRD
jgi:hypothetical protein